MTHRRGQPVRNSPVNYKLCFGTIDAILEHATSAPHADTCEELLEHIELLSVNVETKLFALKNQRDKNGKMG